MIPRQSKEMLSLFFHVTALAIHFLHCSNGRHHCTNRYVIAYPGESLQLWTLLLHLAPSISRGIDSMFYHYKSKLLFELMAHSTFVNLYIAPEACMYMYS